MRLRKLEIAAPTAGLATYWFFMMVMLNQTSADQYSEFSWDMVEPDLVRSCYEAGSRQ